MSGSRHGQHDLHRALDHAGGDAFAGGIDRAEAVGERGLGVGFGVEDLELGVGELEAVVVGLGLALDADGHARVDLASQVRRVEPDEIEPARAVGEDRGEAGAFAVARHPAVRHLAPRRDVVVGLEFDDRRFLGLLVLVPARQVRNELPDRLEPERRQVAGGALVDPGHLDDGRGEFEAFDAHALSSTLLSLSAGEGVGWLAGSISRR